MTQAGDLQPRRGLGQCFMTLGTFQEVCKLVRNCKNGCKVFRKCAKCVYFFNGCKSFTEFAHSENSFQAFRQVCI